MSVIKFIEEDVKRIRTPRKYLAVFSLGTAALSVGLGLMARRDFVDTFTLENLGPAILVLFFAVTFSWIYGSRLQPTFRHLLAIGAIVLALACSLIQPQTPVSLAKFADPGRFWPENIHCLVLGFIGSCLGMALMNVFLLRWAVAPSRFWRATASIFAGLTGMATLSFHCMGPLRSHTIIAHWGQAMAVFPLAYGIQSWLFRRKISAALGTRKNVRRLGRLG